MMRITLTLLGCVGWIVLGASFARAQDPEDPQDRPLPQREMPEAEDDGDAVDPEAQIVAAREAFEAGTRAYDAGLFEEALVSFEAAYELTGSPDLLYNIATVADRLRQDDKALRAYETYLRLRPEAEDREHIEARIRVLREAVQRAEAEERARREAEERARREAEERARREAEEREERPPPPPAEGPGPWPWIVTGAGGAVAVIGGLLVLAAQRDIRAVEQPEGDAPTWDEVDEAYDRAPKLSAGGFVMIGAGVAAVAGGIAWAILGAPDEQSSVEVGLGPGSVTLGGRF